MADDAVGPPAGGGDPVGAGAGVPPDVTPGAGQGTPGEGLGAPVGRRLFLGLIGAGAAGLALTRWQYLGDDAQSPADVAQTVPLSSTGGMPPDREPVEGQHPNISVADGRFRYYSVGDIPDGNPATWRVRVDGQGVDAPVTMSLATLKAFPNVAIRSTFRCVTGWRVRDCVWRGVRLRDVIAASRPNARARFVTLYAGDGVYTDSLTIDQARNDHCILAWELGGQPLIREQGAPLRLVFPDMYGYKNVKWLNRIEVKSTRDIGFWEQQGWEVDAWVYNPDQVQAG